MSGLSSVQAEIYRDENTVQLERGGREQQRWFTGSVWEPEFYEQNWMNYNVLVNRLKNKMVQISGMSYFGCYCSARALSHLNWLYRIELLLHSHQITYMVLRKEAGKYSHPFLSLTFSTWMKWWLLHVNMKRPSQISPRKPNTLKE